jgi:glycosyltransferase involved in cell wall biosynthesis
MIVSENKLKIILVNYRYFVSGGPERYMFYIKSLLVSKGHCVFPFSVKHLLNLKTEYEKYFLSPIGDGNLTYFSEYKKLILRILPKVFSRMFYSIEAKHKFKKLIIDVNPDLIYVLHYQNKISASIFDVAKKFNIPTIHRVSDFGHICANALFFRPKQKDICERCLHGSKINAVINKCIYNSYFLSLIKILAIEFQRINKITKKINAFVVPSKFTISKLSKYGFPDDKLIYIPTFFNQNILDKNIKIEHTNFALYIGRIEIEKGIFTLIKAFENTNYNLKIIGFSTSNYELELNEYLKNKQTMNLV